MLAVVWHYWLGVALFVPAVLIVIGIVIGYLLKVVAPRYPKQ
jgi:amino acid permease